MAEQLLEEIIQGGGAEGGMNQGRPTCAECQYYQEPLCSNSLSNSQILSKDEKQPLSVTPDFGCTNFEPVQEEEIVEEEQVRQPIVPDRY